LKVGATTATLTVRLAVAALLLNAPPPKVTIEAPMSAVSVPPQVVLSLPSTTTPLGKVSMSGALRLAAVASALLKVMVRVETPPSLLVVGLKNLLSVGRMRVTGSTPHTATETALVSNVTAPFRARSLPDTFALVLRVMLVSA
jgi:hypothetical protein